MSSSSRAAIPVCASLISLESKTITKPVLSWTKYLITALKGLFFCCFVLFIPTSPTNPPSTRNRGFIFIYFQFLSTLLNRLVACSSPAQALLKPCPCAITTPPPCLPNYPRAHQNTLPRTPSLSPQNHSTHTKKNFLLAPHQTAFPLPRKLPRKLPENSSSPHQKFIPNSSPPYQKIIPNSPSRHPKNRPAEKVL